MSAISFEGKIWSLVDKKISSNGALITRREARSKVAHLLREGRDVVAFFEEQIIPNQPVDDIGHFRNQATNIVVTRSLSSWLASAFHHGSRYDQKRQSLAMMGHMCSLAEKWLSHINAVIDSEQHKNIIGIKFESFISSVDYRAAILEKMNLEAYNLDLPFQSRFGRGSSFGEDVNKLANPELNLLSRVEYLKDNELFIECLRIIQNEERVQKALEQHYPDDLETIRKILKF
jgi:hypothetical protein